MVEKIQVSRVRVKRKRIRSKLIKRMMIQMMKIPVLFLMKKRKIQARGAMKKVKNRRKSIQSSNLEIRILKMIVIKKLLIE